MQDNTILDHIPHTPSNQPNKRTQRIFLGIELALWGLCLLVYLLNTAGVLSFLIPLVLPFAFVGLFYLICPIWLFGSVGWKRHIGSHLIGIALSGSVLPILFVIQRLSNAAEQIQNALNLSVLASLFTLLFYFLRKDSPRGRRFFLNVLARTVSMAIIAAYLIEVVALRSVR